ncbi:MAG: division/cell wall cluster transcriptional repressor MraZ [Candidatus Andersenbacteria bacterium]|nr:division/cell wall cluster transcriptional repressor MraZ [Candidatus Andersenbacteria bacterium]MBI3250463.1 division/cell wall cluster transcriptional repressor MraZ [Candidatus Andersenbacteria bacterium]
MFIGEYAHSLDEKGRLALPVKFRRKLQEGIVVTRGLDTCLFVYPKQEWEILAQKLAALPLTSKKSRAFTRLMLAGAWDATLDSQGRVMVPEYLRNYANLGKHVVVAGLYNRMEIWNEDSWSEYKAATEKESDNIAEAMGELGV